MSPRFTLPPENQVRTIFSSFDAHDVDRLTALVADDVHLRLGNAPAADGKPAFVEAVDAFIGSVASFRHDIVHVWSDRDALIAELEVHYVRHDGGEVTLPCCNTFRLRDGLIIEYRSYIDINPVYA